MLELIDSGIVEIIGVQDFVNQLRLRFDFRYVANPGHGGNLLPKVASALLVRLADEIRQLDAVHQRVKAQRRSLVVFRLDQRRQFLPHIQRVLVGQR